jgi:electron transfer flavoprotein alpha subunit
VGLTGKTIATEIYLTWAISGASQHLAGCSNAKNIVAINKDANANIFKEAKFGVVGDWKEVYAGFSATVKELVGS